MRTVIALLTALLLASLWLAARAQSTAESRRLGSTTYMNGQDRNGDQWTLPQAGRHDLLGLH
jgi:hypothetical protein